MKPQLLRASKHKAELEYIHSIQQLSRARRHHDQKLDVYQTQSKNFWSELKRPARKGESPNCQEGSNLNTDKLERIYVAQDKLRVAAKNFKKEELYLKSRETVAVKNKVRFDAIESLLRKAVAERKRKAAEILAEEVDSLQSTQSSLGSIRREEAFVSQSGAADSSRCSTMSSGPGITAFTTPQTAKNIALARVQVATDIKVSSIEKCPTEQSITIRSVKPGFHGMSVQVAKAEGKQVRINVGVGSGAASTTGLTDLITNRIRAAYPHLKDITVKVGLESEAKNDLQSRAHRRGLKRGRGDLYDEY